MNAARLLAHYEQIAEAPDALDRLRSFVLALAVRGKLVPQDSRDEPAAALLGGSQHRTSSRDGSMSNVPSGWCAVVLGDLIALRKGKKPDNLNTDGRGYPYLDIAALEKGIVRQHSVDERCPRISSNDLVVVCDGSRSGLLLEGRNGILGSTLASLQHTGFSREYMQVLFGNLYMHLNATKKGAAIPHLNIPHLLALHVLLPPISEQRRIVVKVKELMGLCDRLEAAKAEREAARDQLTASSFFQLNSPDPETFREDARFVLRALPALSARPDQIKQIRQTILNLAVRGKLVPQDPGDEPAVELVAKKWKLPPGYKRGRKIFKEASVDPAAGLRAQLPDTWVYATVDELYDGNIIVDFADGNHGSLYPRSSEFGESGVTFVSAKDLASGTVTWATCAKLNEAWARKLSKGWARTGDVLLTHNATVGRVARVVDHVDPFLLGTSVTFYRLNDEALARDYFYYFLLSPLWQTQLGAVMAQTTRNQVSIQKQAFFAVAIPPRAEQSRIVEKVDELMSLCDRLEASLIEADASRGRLLEALLTEALVEAGSSKPAQERRSA